MEQDLGPIVALQEIGRNKRQNWLKIAEFLLLILTSFFGVSATQRHTSPLVQELRRAMQGRLVSSQADLTDAFCRVRRR